MPSFAKLDYDFSYWQKQAKPLFADLIWNLPERKTGTITLIGGNSQNFSTPIHLGEFIGQHLPFQTTKILLPDALRSKVPPLPNFIFSASTTSGSFAKSPLLADYLMASDVNIMIGDLSKNSATAIALTEALTWALGSSSATNTVNSHSSSSSQNVSNHQLQNRLTILTRDAVDLLAPEASRWLLFPGICLIASMAQLQKVFRAAYYPKMIMLSQPLIPIIETLHKFTLTYPVTILTFHQEQIIVAHHGKIVTTPIIDTDYSPISLWSGQLAARIAALNFFNPNHQLEATATAILYK